MITGLYNPYASPAVSGTNLFVANFADGTNGTIGEYTTSGATINASLITGLHSLYGIAISGSNLFVVNWGGGQAGAGTIGEYTTSGATVNSALITGLNFPIGIAVSGNKLFVTTLNGVGEYTTSGVTVNPSLITGLSGPAGIAVVPEPSTWALLTSGASAFLLFGNRHRRRRRKAMNA